MAAHTERIIMETFQQMLEEMPFYKISVSALVKRCGISPNTFYYHYEDIYDLLETWVGKWLSQFTPKDDWRDSAKAFLKECQTHDKLVDHLLNYLSREQIEQALFPAEEDDLDLFYSFAKSAAGGRDIPEEKLRSIADFCRYASIGFFLRTVWNHLRYDVDQVVDDLDRYIRCFVHAALNDGSIVRNGGMQSAENCAKSENSPN